MMLPHGWLCPDGLDNDGQGCSDDDGYMRRAGKTMSQQSLIFFIYNYNLCKSFFDLAKGGRQMASTLGVQLLAIWLAVGLLAAGRRVKDCGSNEKRGH